jgi:hypothetical protein
MPGRTLILCPLEAVRPSKTLIALHGSWPKIVEGSGEPAIAMGRAYSRTMSGRTHHNARWQPKAGMSGAARSNEDLTWSQGD